MSDQNNDSDGPSGRISLVASVTTPLGVFTLVLLIVEGAIGLSIASLSESQNQFYLILTAIGSLMFIVLLVALMAILNPEALYGYRAFTREHAVDLATLFMSCIDPYLRSLLVKERIEAWEFLSESLSDNEDIRERVQRRFRNNIAQRIRKQMRLTGSLDAKGVIQSDNQPPSRQTENPA